MKADKTAKIFSNLSNSRFRILIAWIQPIKLRKREFDRLEKPIYHDIGIPGVSSNYIVFYLISLCVVCIDPSLIISSTNGIGKWGDNKGLVKKAFLKAVKTDKQEDIKYPKTFSLFKTIFPWILN